MGEGDALFFFLLFFIYGIWQRVLSDGRKGSEGEGGEGYHTAGTHSSIPIYFFNLFYY